MHINALPIYNESVIERNDTQVELIRFRKNIDFIDVENFEVDTFASDVLCQNWAHCYP